MAEGLELLHQAQERDLVQFGENVREGVNFICNCCGCCCEAMIAARRFAAAHPIHTTHFLPVVDEAACTGCERCVRRPARWRPSRRSRPTIRSGRSGRWPGSTPERCLGCGVCVRACREEALALAERGPRRLTPLNGAHRAVLMALERGKLQDLVFDNRLLWSHRALAAFLGAVLKLPPVKRLRGHRAGPVALPGGAGPQGRVVPSERRAPGPDRIQADAEVHLEEAMPVSKKRKKDGKPVHRSVRAAPEADGPESPPRPVAEPGARSTSGSPQPVRRPPAGQPARPRSADAEPTVARGAPGLARLPPALR